MEQFSNTGKITAIVKDSTDNRQLPPPGTPIIASETQYPEEKDSSPEIRSKKTRKTYTITKQRENWTEEEHKKFLEGLKLYNRDWKKIEKFIGTKSVIQIRSHAQKYFLKVQKNKTGERIPPPRPKRKSRFQPSERQKRQDSVHLDWMTTTENMAVNPSLNNPVAFSHWMVSNGLMPGVLSSNFNMNEIIDFQKRQQQELQMAQQHLQTSLSSIEKQKTDDNLDYTKIYSFLGSLFDPDTSDHIQAFNNMSELEQNAIHFMLNNLSHTLTDGALRDRYLFLLERYQSLFQRNENVQSAREIQGSHD